MTAYNSAAFLAEAIESVLAQVTERRWELVIVDDGSTDASLGIAQSYAARWPELVRVLQHVGGANLGISASRNLAVEHARGRLLAFLDSDDVLLPWHCDTLAAVLDARADVAMVYAAAERWVEYGRAFDEGVARAACWGENYLPPLMPAGERGGLLERGVLLEWFMADESLCPCMCAVMVRAEAARAVGGFCDDFRGVYDDQAFHAKVSLRFGVYVKDVCVARYRQHDRSCCAVARRDEGGLADERERFSRFVMEQRAG